MALNKSDLLHSTKTNTMIIQISRYYYNQNDLFTYLVVICFQGKKSDKNDHKHKEISSSKYHQQDEQYLPDHQSYQTQFWHVQIIFIYKLTQSNVLCQQWSSIYLVNVLQEQLLRNLNKLNVLVHKVFLFILQAGENIVDYHFRLKAIGSL